MKVVIVGNGISGVTAARHIRKRSDAEITIVSGESDFFFSRTALMYVYMGHMGFEQIKPYEDDFWVKNRIRLMKDLVEGIDFEMKSLQLASGKLMEYDVLILALGSVSNKFGWPGQDLEGVSGLYHLEDLENMEKFSRGLNRAVVVGGGLIGIEMAEMFKSRNIPVTLLVREQAYWDNVLPKEEAELISGHIREHGFDLRLGVNLEAIIGDESGFATGVIVKETGEKIACGYVGLTPGVRPNIDWLKESALDTDRGILVDPYLRTNQPDVYAIGDCAQLREPPPGRRPIEAVWYTGRMMGSAVAATVCGQAQKYNPGIWFNSAKFLDIEYQVYGDVPPQNPSGIDSIIWQEGEKFLRINYDSAAGYVTGFNLLGLRFRHKVCERWLQQKTPVKEVLENIALAFFDPEFYKRHTAGILEAGCRKLGLDSAVAKRHTYDSVFSFLQKK